MLNSRAAFDNAVMHFPKWMDIRKRKNRSDGGKYLQSIINELDDIQAAIEDYKKDFFIINYIGKEDTVIDYLHVAEIGEVEEDNFILLSPLSKATFDLKEFYFSDAPIALIQGGRLFFKVDEIPADSPAKYSRNGFTYTAKVTKVHIWNVIDEFALYAGIERHEDEKNKELLERTLMVFKNRTNSTELGLKNAIMNVVSNHVNVSPGEIQIEQPNESNLHSPDEEYGSVVERLAQLNKDLYRTKQWDASRWEHPFKKQDYVSPKWDEELVTVQDGVGHNDALKASLLSELENSDASDIQIDLYEKSDVRINEYIRDQRVEVDLDLQLKKYSNVLKPKEVEYKITAAETTDLTDSNVYIECHRVMDGENEHFVSDLVMNPADIADITVERGKLKPNTKYKLQFVPKADYGEMKITKINLLKNGNNESLLKEKGAFKLNERGVLANSNVRLHATSTHSFKDFKNIRNLKNGFTLADATQDGTVLLDVSGMEYQYIKAEYDCKETSIIRDRELVKADSSFVMNEAGQLVSTGEAGEIVIELTCNQLYYEMESGNVIVTKTIDGEQFPSQIWYEAKSEHLKFDEAKQVKIVIRKLGNDKQLVMSDISYARYDVEMRLRYGQFVNTPLGSVIPSMAESDNAVLMTIRTYHGYSPTVYFVHVGSNLKNAMYETDVFQAPATAYIDFDTNCSVRLIELNASGSTVSTIENFVCKNSYKNTRTTPVYVQIDTTGFVSIRRTVPVIDRFSYQGKLSDWIRLDPGKELDTILIDGSVRSLISRVFINDLLREGSYDRIYASRQLKGFIVQSGSSEKLKTLSRESIGLSADAYTVHNLPYGSRGAFIIDSANNVESIGTSHSQAFQFFYVFPSNTQEHVAYNKVRMLRPEMSDVEIVDMFNPIVPAGKLMVYVISPVLKDGLKAKVRFQKNGAFETWSLGKKKVRIQVEIDQEISDNYAVEQMSVNQKFVLSNNINLDEQIEVNGQTVNLGEYVIVPPEGMKVIYENRSSQPESFYAEEDGFNKLKYSNIVSVSSIKRSGSTVPANDYQLLKEEGIIAWKNESLIGEEITIEYRYGVPRYISFVDLEKMYELVGYNVEAYRFLSSLYYRNIREDTLLSDVDIEKLEQSDRAIASSSNPNYRVRIDNDIIRVTKLNEEDYIAIKTGFFYQDGQELYYYANRNENLFERMSNIELINTVRLSGSVKFNQQSKNFLPESSMKPRRNGVTSIIDFVSNERIPGLSKINALTACDNFNFWNTFEMNVGFDKGLNGLGMRFEQTSPEGYAIMDITKYLAEGTILSLYAEGNPEILIAKERKHEGYSFNKSIFAEPFENLKESEDFRYFVFNEQNFEEDVKYYLVVKDNGLIDDIVIKDYVATESIRSIHQKTLSTLGFDIQERATINYIQKLLFDVDGNHLNHLEISEDGTVQTGVNVDWGFTKVNEFKNDWKSCSLKEVDLVKDSYVRSEGKAGSVETGAIYVRNKDSLRSMIVKINEVLMNSTSGFRIEVYTAERAGGKYNLIAYEEDSNTLIIPAARLSNYIMVKVDMPSHKVITNLEVYSEYAETSTPLRVGEYENGQLTTKVYDTGFVKHYAIKRFIADEVTSPESIEISVRAFRQDENRLVWTDWKTLILNEDLEVVNSVEFEDYRFFQFQIALHSNLASIKLNNIELEVIR